MKVLLDTNIIVHREANRVVNSTIGDLFRLMEKHGVEKRVHPITLDEIARARNTTTRQTMGIKVGSYMALPTTSPMAPQLKELSQQIDTDENSKNDSVLLNELYVGTVDALITEDRGIHHKARVIGISDHVFSIDSFLEKLISEHPDLVDYPVPSARKTYFGSVNLDDSFFDSFKLDYVDFEKWFRRKSEEVAYVCETRGCLVAFLYLKTEETSELYSDIEPKFQPKRRLKIGTFKVVQNGYKIGERFLKIVFDNALSQNVDEIYVTIFRNSLDHERLVSLLTDFGFAFHGRKSSESGVEDVLVRKLSGKANLTLPRSTYPFLSSGSQCYIVPIYPEYHTSLFPDSILRTESPDDFVELQPHRNAIRKVYISRSINRSLSPGDLIVFYRTGGYHKSVVSTVGIVERVYDHIRNFEEFKTHCQKRSVFTDNDLLKHWNYKPYNRPFVVQFLYAFSFPKRPNMKRLIELDIIQSVDTAPRGFEPISRKHFNTILREADIDESAIIH